MNPDSFPTPLQDYITEMLPWAHGHQAKVITDYVAVIINKQTGIQAALARSFGNQEAACKRVSRLLHNERLKPNDLAEAVIHQALRQVLRSRRMRFTGRVKRTNIYWSSRGWWADAPCPSIGGPTGRAYSKGG